MILRSLPVVLKSVDVAIISQPTKPIANDTVVGDLS